MTWTGCRLNTSGWYSQGQFAAVVTQFNYKLHVVTLFQQLSRNPARWQHLTVHSVPVLKANMVFEKQRELIYCFIFCPFVFTPVTLCAANWIFTSGLHSVHVSEEECKYDLMRPNFRLQDAADWFSSSLQPHFKLINVTFNTEIPQNVKTHTCSHPDLRHTDLVCCYWGVSAPPGPWGPGPASVWPPGSVRSLWAAAVAPVQKPPAAAAAADPAASGNAAAAPETPTNTTSTIRSRPKSMNRCE